MKKCWNCPECGYLVCEPVQAHQHPNGEWILTQSIADYYRFKRWDELKKKAEEQK